MVLFNLFFHLIYGHGFGLSTLHVMTKYKIKWPCHIGCTIYLDNPFLQTVRLRRTGPRVSLTRNRTRQRVRPTRRRAPVAQEEPTTEDVIVISDWLWWFLGNSVVSKDRTNWTDIWLSICLWFMEVKFITLPTLDGLPNISLTLQIVRFYRNGCV